jgi:hypothetical protein
MATSRDVEEVIQKLSSDRARARDVSTRYSEINPSKLSSPPLPPIMR